MIIAERPYEVGDRVTMAGASGEIQRIGLRAAVADYRQRRLPGDHQSIGNCGGTVLCGYHSGYGIDANV